MVAIMKKKILLTGGSRGIGYAILKELEGDYDVVAPTREELDLTSLESINNFFEKNLYFDVLINNAGINIVKNIEDIKDEDIEEINIINLIAPLKLIQHVVKNMKENNYGRIINVSSIWGIKSKEKRTLYSATKFGLIGQTKALARELGEYNILVNSICPGFTSTTLTIKNLSKNELVTIKNEIPLQRLAEPAEIAKSIRFLVSDDSSYMTGQTLVIDGGFTA